MLGSLATLADLEKRYGPVADPTMAQAALDDASTLVRAEAGVDWAGVGEVPPDAVVVVVLAAAARGLRNPDGVEVEGVGQYNVRYGAGLGGVWLTRNERRTVRRAVSGTSGLGSIELESPWQPAVQTVPVDIGGDDMPWVTLGEGDDE